MAATRSASRSASSFSARDRRDGSRDQPVAVEGGASGSDRGLRLGAAPGNVGTDDLTGGRVDRLVDRAGRSRGDSDQQVPILELVGKHVAQELCDGTNLRHRYRRRTEKTSMRHRSPRSNLSVQSPASPPPKPSHRAPPSIPPASRHDQRSEMTADLGDHSQCCLRTNRASPGFTVIARTRQGRPEPNHLFRSTGHQVSGPATGPGAGVAAVGRHREPQRPAARSFRARLAW